MNNIITIRQFVSIIQQKGFMDEQPDACESVVLSFFHTIAEALKTDDIVSVDGLGDFTIVNRESGLIVFLPDQSLADTVNEPFAFFEPTEISDDVPNEMLSTLSNEKGKNKPQNEVVATDDVEEEDEDESDNEPVKTTGPVKIDPRDRNAYVISVPKTENQYHEQTSVSQPGSFEETPDPKTLEREEELKREQELRRELERELDLRREMELKRHQELLREQEEAERARNAMELLPEIEESQPELIPVVDYDEVKRAQNSDNNNNQNNNNVSVNEKDNHKEKVVEKVSERVSEPHYEDVNSTDIVDDNNSHEAPTQRIEQQEPASPKTIKRNGYSTISLVAISILVLAIGFVAGLFCAETLFGSDDDDDIGYQPNISEQMEQLEEIRKLMSADDAQMLDSLINNSIEQTPEETSKVEQVAQPKEDEVKIAEASLNDDEQVVVTDTVKENYFLTHMSRHYYGGAMEFWVYIYLENQDHLDHPAKIKPNTVVVIPPAEKYGIDPKSKKSIELAKQIAAEINSKYK